MKRELTECSETSVCKILTPRNYPKERIQQITISFMKKISVRKCLHLFSAEYFVFQFAIEIMKIMIYRTVILFVIFDGFETWSFTLMEKQRQRLSENRVVGNTFGPQRDEVTGEWRKLHKDQLYALYVLPNIIRWLNQEEWDGLDVWYAWRDRTDAYWLLLGRLEGIRLLGRRRHRWYNNIKMCPLEVGWESIDWRIMVQDIHRWRAFVNGMRNLQVP